MRQKNGLSAVVSKSPLLFSDTGVAITPMGIEDYLEALRRKGCRPDTIQTYRRNLQVFYRSLPEGKQVGMDTLAHWCESLSKMGYKPRTINVCISSVNGLLEFMDLQKYQLRQQLIPPEEALPELTRNEYLRLLSVARALGKERTYLLIKMFACTELALEDLSCVTAAAVEDGRIITNSNRVQRIIRLPSSLREELLNYIRREGLLNGPVFVTRNGRMLERTSVTGSIQRLAREAQVAPEKCNPRCLRKLYQTTWAGIEANFLLLIEQAHERLLETEQFTIGWKEDASL